LHGEDNNIYKVCSLQHVILLSQSSNGDVFVHMKDIIGTDEDPGLRIESFAITKLRGVNYKLYKH
jgi:hypothetical protein